MSISQVHKAKSVGDTPIGPRIVTHNETTMRKYFHCLFFAKVHCERRKFSSETFSYNGHALDTRTRRYWKNTRICTSNLCIYSCTIHAERNQWLPPWRTGSIENFPSKWYKSLLLKLPMDPVSPHFQINYIINLSNFGILYNL